MTYPAATPPFKGLGTLPKPPITFPAIFPEADLAPFHKIMTDLARQFAYPPRPLTKVAPLMPTENTPDAFTLTDPDGDKLTVESTYVERHKARVAEVDLEDAPCTVYVTKDDAPALALAVLEAAGWTTGPHGYAQAVSILKDGIAARKAREEANKELDAEALKLLNAATGENYVSLSNVGTIADFWRRAARKAREIHAPAPEPKPAPKAPEKAPGARYALVEYLRKLNGETGWGIFDREKDTVAPFGFARTAAAKALSESPASYIYEPASKYTFNR